MHTDPVADYLTRIRNAVKARHRIVDIPTSNVKKGITKILFTQGYILSYKFDDENKVIKIALKYDPKTKLSAITSLDRVSTPGLRKYAKASSMPRVINGLGVAIISTSKGIMTGKEATRSNVGGEVLCYIS